MKISLDWIKAYVDNQEPPAVIAQMLTRSGLEVESVTEYTSTTIDLSKLIVGCVTQWDTHPNADRLYVATVDVGKEEPLRIVCGANNVSIGCKVIVAPVGAEFLNAKGHVQRIVSVRIRGVASQGMLCAEEEIGFPKTRSGVAIVDSSLETGSAIDRYFSPYRDTILQVDITPNRADACSHFGIARELGMLTHSTPSWPSVDRFKEPESSRASLQVRVADSGLCVRCAAAVVQDVRIGTSPPWLQDRLKSIGVTPQHNVADVVRFVLHETGQPIQALDYDTVSNGQLVIEESRAGVAFTTACGEEKKTIGGELIVCDAQSNVVSLAGVSTSLPFSVGTCTQNILLVSACFSAANVRKNTKIHRLHTEASFRGERGIDPNLVVYALKRAALLMQETAGGQVATSIVDVYPTLIKDTKVQLNYETISRVLGVKLSSSTVKQIISKLGMRVSYEEENRLLVTVPTYRTDVKREIDVIAEIARIYGYDQIPPSKRLSYAYLKPTSDAHMLRKSVGTLLAHSGYYELCTLPFAAPTDLIDTRSERTVTVSNPSSASVARLRQTMLPAGLRVIAHNIHRGQKSMGLFEFGNIYTKDATWYKEVQHLCVWLTGSTMPRDWQEDTREVGLQDLYATVYKILHHAGITDFTTESLVANDTYANHIQVKLNQAYVASAGTLRTELCNDFGIYQKVLFAQLPWPAMLHAATGLRAVSPVSKFPKVVRDLSLVINKDVSFGSVQRVFLKNRNDVIQQMSLINIYEGQELESTKKSYTVRCILQSQNATLTEPVIRRAMKKLATAFEQTIGAIIRTPIK